MTLIKTSSWRRWSHWQCCFFNSDEFENTHRDEKLQRAVIPPFWHFVCSTNEAAYLGGPGAASAMTQGITDVVEYMNRSTGFWQHIFPGVTVARMVGGRVNARRKRELVPYMKQARNQHWHFVKCEPSMIPESPTMEIGCRVLTTWNPMRLMRGALTGSFLHV